MIGEKRYREMQDPARSGGAILEPNAFHPRRSGRDQLRILADGAGIDPGRIAEMLEAVGLTHTADRHADAPRPTHVNDVAASGARPSGPICGAVRPCRPGVVTS
jgi:hypothetical protein